MVVSHVVNATVSSHTICLECLNVLLMYLPVRSEEIACRIFSLKSTSHKIRLSDLLLINQKGKSRMPTGLHQGKAREGGSTKLATPASSPQEALEAPSKLRFRLDCGATCVALWPPLSTCRSRGFSWF